MEELKDYVMSEMLWDVSLDPDHGRVQRRKDIEWWIDEEGQKALRNVKHSRSEVIRALTLGSGDHSGIDRKIHAGARRSLRASRGVVP